MPRSSGRNVWKEDSPIPVQTCSRGETKHKKRPLNCEVVYTTAKHQRYPEVQSAALQLMRQAHGYFVPLSKPATIEWLDASEWALLLFSAILIIGIVGEVKLPSWHHLLKRFEILVLVGVLGELIADGGIFLFSSHLQRILDSENAALDLEASRARKEANEANERTKGLEAKVATSNAEAKKATERAAQAEALEKRYESQIAQAQLEFERFRAPRELTVGPAIGSKLKAFKGTPYDIAVSLDSDSNNLAASVVTVLDGAGWVRKDPPAGIFRVPLSYTRVFAAVVFHSGIRIDSESRGQTKSWSALFEMFAASGIRDLIGASPTLPNDPIVVPYAAQLPIHIIIGEKPKIGLEEALKAPRKQRSR
jgi:hypothetical protein